MIDLNWQRSRLVILGSYSLVISAALLLVWTKPSKDRLTQDLALSGWTEIESDRLISEHQLALGRKTSQKQHNLEIEIYHLPTNSGDTLRSIERYWAIEIEQKDLAMKSDSQIGSYGLLAKDNRTFLHTCIHGSGRSAFDPRQFSKLANENLSSRLLPWIFGLKDLRDWDCFWVNMSVSTSDLTDKEAHQYLKQRLGALLQKIKSHKLTIRN